MKNTRKLIELAIIAIITIGIVACNNGNNDKPTHTHQWGEWTETKAPTLTDDGEETKTCATCGEKETRPIVKLESFTVTFNANGGTPQPQPQTIAKGGKASEPTAPTKTNYSIVGWYKETALTTEWDFAADTVTAEITLHAKWEQIIRGYITDTDRPIVNIPIYQTAGVTDEQAIAATAKIKAGYGILDALRKNGIAGKVKEILIVTGENDFEVDSTTGKVIFKFNFDATKGNVNDYIWDTCDYYPVIWIFKISKEAGITVKQMNDTVTNINNAYGELTSEVERGKFATKVKAIIIVSGDVLNLDGTTLNVGESTSYVDLLDYIFDFIYSI